MADRKIPLWDSKNKLIKLRELLVELIDDYPVDGMVALIDILKAVKHRIEELKKD